MAKVIQIFDYEINPNSVQKYKKAVEKLKISMSKVKGLSDFIITNSKSNKNQFQEIYIFENEDAYENYEEFLNDDDNDIISEIQEYIVSNSTKYLTYIEI